MLPVVAGDVPRVHSRVVGALYPARPSVTSLQHPVAVGPRQQLPPVAHRGAVAVAEVGLRAAEELVGQLEVKVVTYTLEYPTD